MCVHLMGIKIFAQVMARLRLQSWYLMKRLKKSLQVECLWQPDHFSKFWRLKCMRFFPASLNRVLESMNGRWLIYKMSSRFKLLNLMLSTDNSDFMKVWGFSHCCNQVMECRKLFLLKTRLFSTMYAFLLNYLIVLIYSHLWM